MQHNKTEGNNDINDGDSDNGDDAEEEAANKVLPEDLWASPNLQNSC